ncbi:TonB-dependent siderophore receptor [Rhizobium sp. DKSPLA3]|uniref:TonB-dependent siderophore receptor n=1 Tax=Rhizobium quercicola TaxID=2901226 RepID=A0A9X1SZH5_9HYPH|nr:TonB-dependent siderophore receptor [Rhizobium quercicola]MCD7108009.1 TonB-dependent siderophore receptor [Rhizobium quercicola]
MIIDRTRPHRRLAPLSRRSAILLGCTALAALSPAIASAQDAAAGATALETIVVRGGPSGTVLDTDNDSQSIVATETTATGKLPTDILKAPAAVSVITSKEIEQRAADTVEQVVQYTAGVVTDFYGSDDRYDYFDIRGFTPYTYRDGLAIGRTFAGTREEPYAYERIEVLKGASSSGFGAAEPGGSVNYVTKTPKRERFGEVYGTGGSFAHKELGFDFGDNLTGDDTLSYRLTGKFQRADAEYDYSQDDENFLMGGVTWRPDAATNLTVVFDHLDKDGVPGSGGHPLGTNFDRDTFFGEPDYYFSETNRNSTSVMFDHDFGNGLSFGSNARYSNLNDGFGSAYIGGTPTDGSTTASRYFFGSDKSSEQFIIDANLVYETRTDTVESRTLLGTEYNKFESDTDNCYTSAPSIDWENPIYSGGPGSLSPYSSVNNDQKTAAVYLQQDLTFFDKLTVSVGLRNDWLDLSETDRLAGSTASGNHSEFTKRIGASYKITEELAPYISYAESAAPPASGADPTTGKQYELGIKYRPEAFPALITASVYDLTKGNITVYDQVTYLPQSVEKVRHRGFELEAKAEVTDQIDIIAAYSYIDSKIDEPDGANDGNRLMRVPKHLASIWGTYTLAGQGARGDMTFGVGARYLDSYYTDIGNTKSSESAVVFDVAYTYKIQENTTFQLNVNNVFDEKHIASTDSGAVYYNPGRKLMATLRQTW